VERVRRHIGLEHPVELALDVGCGAGLSTRALAPIARHRLGLDPAAAMVRLGSQVAPGAHFGVASAERLPLRQGSVDLISAAGSLNYADLGRFLEEAARVLAVGGVLVVYDFTPGRRIPGSDALTRWFDELLRRWPSPRESARRELDPEVLAGESSLFRLRSSDLFEIGLELDVDFYLEYVMTEANIAHALRSGASAAAIREWCRDSLAPIFGGSHRRVLFEGYIAYLEATA
jgi:SAM-dependent methyltransferase